MTPPALDRVVVRCLAKKPDERWDSAHDVADELRWLQDTSGGAALTGAPRRRRWGLRLALIVAAGVALLIIGAAVAWRVRPPRRA